MDDYEIVTKPRAEFNPDATIDFGRNEYVFLQIKVLTKSEKRREYLEKESIKILKKLRDEKEYRIHFDEPFLILEDKNGEIKRGKTKIKNGVRYIICKALLEKPSAHYKFNSMLDYIYGKDDSFPEKNHTPKLQKKLVRAIIDINDVTKKDFGLSDDIILYIRDGKDIMMVNPVFKRKKT